MSKFEISADKDRKISVFVFYGNILEIDIISALNKFYSESPTIHIFADFTQADVSAISIDKLRNILDVEKKNREVRRGGKSALVFSDTFAFALGRMYEIKADIGKMPFKVRSFKSSDAAFKWLSETD